MLNHIQKDLSLVIYTPERTKKAISLVTFPAEPLRPTTYRTMIKRISQGKVSRGKTTCIQNLLQEWAIQKHNQIVVENAFKSVTLTDEMAINEIKCDFYPSPCNSLWASTGDWPIDESSPKWHKVFEDASWFERSAEKYEVATKINVRLALDTSLDKEEIYIQLLPILARSFPRDILDMVLIGGGGLNIANILTRNYLSFVMSVETTLRMDEKIDFFNSLGDRFATLQPVMIGPASLCLEIKKALGPEVTDHSIVIDGQPSSTSLLYVPQSVLADPLSVERANEYLVSKRSPLEGLR